jgi:hypothetical protein
LDPEDVRAQIEAHRPARGAPYDDEIRQVVVTYVRQRRGQGRTWEQIGAEVGLSGTTLQNWSRSGARFRPVAIIDDAQPDGSQLRRPVSPALTQPTPAGLVLHTPTGFRLEGLDLRQAFSLLQALR